MADNANDKPKGAKKRKAFGYIPQADKPMKLAERIETYEHHQQKVKTKREADREKKGKPAPAKPHRWRPGSRALQEIRYYQRRTELVVSRYKMWRQV